MKLGIGSAQFGFDYGISNVCGKTPVDEVRNILTLAAQSGISIIDTASQYGDSEDVIGMCLPDNHKYRIVTKTPTYKKASLNENDALLLKETLYASLAKLKQKSLYGLLIHYADDLLSVKGALLWRTMQELQQKGFVQYIGVSVYSPPQIDEVLNAFQIDLIQLPVNVLDQRMVRNGHLKRLKDAGIEIHSRSVFLQGVLLMDPITLPEYLLPVREHLLRYHQSLREHRFSPIEAALGFVSEIPEIDTIIIGVDNSHQLHDIVSVTAKTGEISEFNFSAYAVEDPQIINPSLWRTLGDK